MSSIKLIKGSCVEQEVDAIVNAANKKLLSGGGICGAIYREAGFHELNDACSKIPTPLHDGDAVITPAFRIKNCKKIIHAVGPDFNVTPNGNDRLVDAYYNSLVVLMKNNLHSIAFPLLSSGLFSGNIEKPALVSFNACVSAYQAFTMEYDYEVDVIVCVYSDEEWDEINTKK